jgi:chromosome segregation ATPase
VGEVFQAAQEAERALGAKQSELDAVRHELQVSQAESELLHKELETIEASYATLQASSAAEMEMVQKQAREQLEAAQAQAHSHAIKCASVERQLTEAMANHQYDLKCSASVQAELEDELKQVRAEQEQLVRKQRDAKKRAEELAEALRRSENELADAETKLAQSVPAASASSRTSGGGAAFGLGVSKEKLAALNAEVERLNDALMAARSHNAQLDGRLTATQQLAAGEQSKLKSRLASAEAELTTLRSSSNPLLAAQQAQVAAQHLAALQKQLATSQQQIDDLRTDKEQLLQQVELMMESAESGAASSASSASIAAATSELTAQVSSLQKHNAELKAYVVRYKASGEEKMRTLVAEQQRVLHQVALLVQTLVQRGMVSSKPGADQELYQQVQALAQSIKNTHKPAAAAAAVAAK